MSDDGYEKYDHSENEEDKENYCLDEKFGTEDEFLGRYKDYTWKL